MNERQWNGKSYRTLKEQGVTKNQAGVSAHGLPHAYAYQRHEQITGFTSPVKFASLEDFKIKVVHTTGTIQRNIPEDPKTRVGPN